MLYITCEVTLTVRSIVWVTVLGIQWMWPLYNYRWDCVVCLFRRHADPWSRRWLHLHCPSSDHGACPAYWLHPAGACIATDMPSLFVCIFVSECPCQLCTHRVCILIAACDLGQLKKINLQLLHFIFPGADCSTGSACLPSTGAVCGGKQWRLHQWKHVSKSVTQLCSVTSQQILVLSPCSLFFLLLSLMILFMSQAHDVGGSAFTFLCVFVLLFWQVCSCVFNCAQSPEHEHKKGHALSADAMPGSLGSEEWVYILLTSPGCIHTLARATGRNTYVNVASSA